MRLPCVPTSGRKRPRLRKDAARPRSTYLPPPHRPPAWHRPAPRRGPAETPQRHRAEALGPGRQKELARSPPKAAPRCRGDCSLSP